MIASNLDLRSRFRIIIIKRSNMTNRTLFKNSQRGMWSWLKNNVNCCSRKVPQDEIDLFQVKEIRSADTTLNNVIDGAINDVINEITNETTNEVTSKVVNEFVNEVAKGTIKHVYDKWDELQKFLSSDKWLLDYSKIESYFDLSSIEDLQIMANSLAHQPFLFFLSFIAQQYITNESWVTYYTTNSGIPDILSFYLHSFESQIFMVSYKSRQREATIFDISNATISTLDTIIWPQHITPQQAIMSIFEYHWDGLRFNFPSYGDIISRKSSVNASNINKITPFELTQDFLDGYANLCKSLDNRYFTLNYEFSKIDPLKRPSLTFRFLESISEPARHTNDSFTKPCLIKKDALKAAFSTNYL